MTFVIEKNPAYQLSVSFFSIYLSVVSPWICIIVIACFLAYSSLFITHLSFIFILSINPAFRRTSTTWIEEKEKRRGGKVSLPPPPPRDQIVVEYAQRISSNDSFSLLSCICRSIVLIYINVCDDRRWSNFNILTLFYRWKKEGEREREREKRMRKYQLPSCKKENDGSSLPIE